jgi:phytanoyl-CoA hydroxylase
MPLLDHGYPDWEKEGGVNRSYFGITKIPSQNSKIYPEMRAGDTVFFHPHVIHGSGENKT